MIGPRGRPLRWPVVQGTASRGPPAWNGASGGRPPRRGPRGVERGAHRGRQPAPHAPGRAAEREVGHGGEARLVLAQGEQQVRRAVGGGQARDRRRARTSSARGGRRAGRAARPPPPRATRRGRPRSSTRPVRACSSRASWPTRSPSRPSAVRSAPVSRRRAGRTTFAPRLACSSGIAHACASASADTGARPGSIPTRIPAVATNGTLWAAVLSVHSRSRTRSACGVDRRAPRDRGALRGRPAAAAGAAAPAAGQPPAIGRRRITRPASAGSAVTWRACPSPSLTTA